jgi:outer membrane protein TolC
LSARTQYAEQGRLLERNLEAARASERLYEWRYRSGYAALKDWLDAQETRRTAEVSLALNRYNRLLNQMTLYQALGGDARVNAPDAQPPGTPG